MQAAPAQGDGQARAAGREPVRLVVAADQPGTSAGVSRGWEREGSDAAGGAVSVALLNTEGDL